MWLDEESREEKAVWVTDGPAARPMAGAASICPSAVKAAGGAFGGIIKLLNIS